MYTDWVLAYRAVRLFSTFLSGTPKPRQQSLGTQESTGKHPSPIDLALTKALRVRRSVRKLPDVAAHFHVQ